MSEQEQNKKINELNRRVARLEAFVKTFDLDLAPGGRVSEAFDQIENHLEQHDKKLDRLQYDRASSQWEIRCDFGKNHGTFRFARGVTDLIQLGQNS